MKNIVLFRKEDGYWLCVKSSTGKQAMLNLNNLKGEIIRQAFLDWAEENYDEQMELEDLKHEGRMDKGKGDKCP